MRVGVFVGTRADLGPLETVIAALADASDIELIVLGGVVWVLYLALQSLLAAAGFGSTPDPSEPATGAPAVPEVSSVEASPSLTEDVLEGESSAVVISPSDLPQF